MKPFIQIIGDSGAGKTTLTGELCKIFFLERLLGSGCFRLLGYKALLSGIQNLENISPEFVKQILNNPAHTFEAVPREIYSETYGFAAALVGGSHMVQEAIYESFIKSWLTTPFDGAIMDMAFRAVETPSKNKLARLTFKIELLCDARIASERKWNDSQNAGKYMSKGEVRESIEHRKHIDYEGLDRTKYGKTFKINTSSLSIDEMTLSAVKIIMRRTTLRPIIGR